MAQTDPFRYDGKRALVVGGATGMGAAAAKRVAAQGGEVIVMDRAPIEFDVDQAIQLDLSDPASIDAALGELDGPVDAVFSAAGIADGPPLMRINFIGHRYLLDQARSRGLLGRGGAICFISSVAGIGWEGNLETLVEFIGIEDYEQASAWVDAHEATNNYGFSKQAINTYVARQAYPLIAEGIRINAICPGPTDTPLAQANAELWLTFAQDYRDATGLEAHSPEQMGDTMVFLNSDAARGISGVTLLVDSGHVMASTSGSWEEGKPLMDLLKGLTFS